MAAYLISAVTAITDPAGFEEYRQRVAATVKPYGGRYLARTRAIDVLEGDWAPHTVVVIEFESVERAKQWWASEEYREIRQIRRRTAVTSLIVVEGAP